MNGGLGDESMAGADGADRIDGGDGGDGGSVWIVCDGDKNHLGDFRRNELFKGEHGIPGSGNKCYGRNGADCEIAVPPGTLVFDVESDEEIADLAEPGQRVMLAEGGRGGRGNARFATSKRQAPRYAQPGLPVIHLFWRLDLQLFVEIVRASCRACVLIAVLALSYNL